MRNPEVDRYIYERFGKPDYPKSFIGEDGQVWTPIGKVRLWRLDPLLSYERIPRQRE